MLLSKNIEFACFFSAVAKGTINAHIRMWIDSHERSL